MTKGLQQGATERATPEDATLLDILIDGFEKNEVLEGFHWRRLPMPDEQAAARKFSSLTDEARRWKGPPTRTEGQSGRRLSAWPDLEIRQAGRGLVVRARAAGFSHWWNDERTWQGDPLGRTFDWIAEETQE
jgi:hypothetical protein